MISFMALDRLEALASERGLPLAPIQFHEIELSDGWTQTPLGVLMRSSHSGEVLWVRNLEHWGHSSYLPSEDGTWWPPAFRDSIRVVQDEDGPVLVIGNTSREALDAMVQDVEATLEWLARRKQHQVRFQAKTSLERAQGELKDLLAELLGMREINPLSRDPSVWEQFEARLLGQLAFRIKILKSLGATLTPAAYERRLENELSLIRQHGLESAFYLLADLGLEFPRRERWLGPGYGPLPGSLVAWLLKVTDLDPVAQELQFEPLLAQMEEDQTIVFEIASEKAGELECWLGKHASMAGISLSIRASEPLTKLAKIQRESGLRNAHPSWHPVDSKVYEHLRLARPSRPHGSMDSDAESIRSFLDLMVYEALQRQENFRETVLHKGDEVLPQERLPWIDPSSPVWNLLGEPRDQLLFHEQITHALIMATHCSALEGERYRRALVSGNQVRANKAREELLQKGTECGYPPDLLNQALDLFVGYGHRTLSKSHIASRAALAYELAWWELHGRDEIGHE